jgi:hypothetical protein
MVLLQRQEQAMRNQTRQAATDASPAREGMSADMPFALNSSIVVGGIWLAFYVIAAAHFLISGS